MERKVRVALYGIGAIGSHNTKYVLAKGGEIVAAFGHSEKQVGKDLGEVAGLGKTIGLTISHSDNLEQVLQETKPDILIFSTKALLADIKDAAIVALKNKVNVLDIGENAFWPWTNEAEVAAELDQVAKDNGVTISASGFPEVIWGSLISSLAAASNTITSIRCDSCMDLEAYNADYMFEYHGVGLTPEEFEKKFSTVEVDEQDGHAPCLPGDQNAWLASKLGLHITRQTMVWKPVILEKDLYSPALGKTLPAGTVEGLGQITRSYTEEGITIDLCFWGRMICVGDDMHTTWTIEGDPSNTIALNDSDVYELTSASAMNRIPDVINAAAGFVTTDQMPSSRYLVRPMNEYVND